MKITIDSQELESLQHGCAEMLLRLQQAEARVQAFEQWVESGGKHVQAVIADAPLTFNLGLQLGLWFGSRPRKQP